ncbi:MAG: hypothetical protein V4694_03295 [Pseudomonadota bacterium]
MPFFPENANLVEQTTSRYSTLKPDSLIKGTRLWHRINDEFQNEHKSHSDKYSQNNNGELKLSLASCKIAEFLSQQSTREYSARKDSLVFTKKVLANNIFGYTIPIHLSFLAIAKSDHNGKQVPCYSENKKQYISSFREILASVRDASLETLNSDYSSLLENIQSKVSLPSKLFPNTLSETTSIAVDPETPSATPQDSEISPLLHKGHVGRNT